MASQTFVVANAKAAKRRKRKQPLVICAPWVRLYLMTTNKKDQLES